MMYPTNSAVTMGHHLSRAAFNSWVSSIAGKSNVQSTLTMWGCATCGRRYDDPATVGPFITPPPITECTAIQTDESWTHANGGFVNLSITGGATCDYVRINRGVGETDLSKNIGEPEDTTSAADLPFVNEVSAWACDNASMKAEGEHGRVSRQNGGARAEDDGEDCEFWKAECRDIDCIYAGEHCREQCAMAELDEAPKAKAKAPAPKRGLRFLRLAR